MRVRNLGSNRTEVLFTDAEGIEWTVFFSYETPVAAHCDRGEGIGFYRTEKRWSQTTSRHINAWLRDQGGPDRVKVAPQDFFDTLTESR